MYKKNCYCAMRDNTGVSNHRMTNEITHIVNIKKLDESMRL